MRVTHKFEISRSAVVQFPVGAEVLRLGVQGAKLVLWALVEPDVPCTEEVEFRVLYTGEEVENLDAAKFVGTAQFSTGIVVHVFRA